MEREGNPKVMLQMINSDFSPFACHPSVLVPRACCFLLMEMGLIGPSVCFLSAQVTSAQSVPSWFSIIKSFTSGKKINLYLQRNQIGDINPPTINRKERK